MASQNHSVGDVVVLGMDVPAEFRGHPAVILTAHEKHATVYVLNHDRRYAIGECWPNYTSIAHVESTRLREGNRIVVGGMTSPTMLRLNGLTGTIVKHPTQRCHPVWFRKPDFPDRPIFTVCVRFDDRKKAGQRMAMLDPCHLRDYEETRSEMSEQLSRALQMIEEMGIPMVGSQAATDEKPEQPPIALERSGGDMDRVLSGQSVEEEGYIPGTSTQPWPYHDEAVPESWQWCEESHFSKQPEGDGNPGEASEPALEPPTAEPAASGGRSQKHARCCVCWDWFLSLF